jgi:hypothetical protein
MDYTEKTLRAVIDRIEGNTAVIELGNEEMFLPLVLLPKNVKQGNILEIKTSINQTEEKKQIDKIKNLQKKLKTNQ